jgi:hypothetical protein
MDFLAFVLRFFMRGAKGVGFFFLAFLLWEIVALFAMSHFSLSMFSGGISPLVFAVAFLNGLYALPIVLYIAIAYAVSQQLNGRARLLTFVGLCCVGSLGLIGFFMKFSTNLAHLRENGFVAFVAYPTLCVFALYLWRPVFQQPHAVRVGE